MLSCGRVAILFFAVAGAKVSDVCNDIDSTSYCMETGRCSGNLTLSCDEAYMRVSDNYLRYLGEPPIIHSISPDEFMQSIRMTAPRSGSMYRSSAAPHLDWNSHHTALMKSIGEFGTKMFVDFPLVRRYDRSIARMIETARAVRSNFIDTLSVTDRYIYHSVITERVNVNAIHTYFAWVLRHLYSMDRSDTMRTFLVANLIPLVHAWIEVHRILLLPQPFIGSNYLELLTQVSQYHPQYTDETVWTLSLNEFDYTASLVLPILPTEFSMQIYDVFEMDPDWPIDAAMGRILQLIKYPNVDRIRAALYFIRYHPRVTQVERIKFCEDTRNKWPMTMLSLESTMEMESVHVFDLLEIFRVCGRDYFTVQDKVNYILLPLTPQFEDPQPDTVCDLSPWFRLTDPMDRLFGIFRRIALTSPGALRGQLLIVFDSKIPNFQDQHQRVLDELVQVLRNPSMLNLISNFDTKKFVQDNQVAKIKDIKASFIGIGITVGLMVLAGDPNSVLENIIRDNYSIYMHSRSVRSGFCRVIDCLMFETLFDNTQIPQVLSMLRNSLLRGVR